MRERDMRNQGTKPTCFHGCSASSKAPRTLTRGVQSTLKLTACELQIWSTTDEIFLVHTRHPRPTVEWEQDTRRQETYIKRQVHKRIGNMEHWSVLEQVVCMETHLVCATAQAQVLELKKQTRTTGLFWNELSVRQPNL